jgi:putative transposase
MKLASLTVGLHLTLNNIPYRINRIIHPDRFELERVSDLALKSSTKSELLTMLSKGSLKLTGGDYVVPSIQREHREKADLSSIPTAKQKVVWRKFEYVKTAIKILGATPTLSNLSPIIEHVARRIGDESQPSQGTLYRWWHRYTASDNDLLALVDKSSGKTGNRAFSKLVIDELNEIIESVYLTEQKPSKKHVYRIFKNRINELNLTQLEPLKFPSRAHFYRLMKQLHSYDVMAAREGKATADNHFRATAAGPLVRYILERVEVDHTILDVHAVNPETGKVEGRPTLTVILDVYSRMVLGLYIGFEPPSQLSVMRALRHAILPKDLSDERYKGIEDPWPTYGNPVTLVCDNGLEFHSDSLKRFCGELNIDLQFCPKKSPQHKGTVERFIGTLNRQVCHLLPGTTFSNVEERGEYDSEGKACLTLEEIRNLIYRWIVVIYSQEIHSTTKRTPIALWQEGLEIVEPMLPESVQQLNLALTLETRRTLTHKGIEIFNQFYNSSALKALRERAPENYSVIVRYDEENIGSIWVYDERHADFIRVPSTTPEYSEGLSSRQHSYIRQKLIEKGLKEQNEKAVLAHRARLYEAIQLLKSEKLIRERRKGAQLDQSDPDKKLSLAATEEHDVPDDGIFELVDLPAAFPIETMRGSL